MTQKFPYTPTAGALVQFLGQLRKSFPAVVDASVLKKLGLASNNESYILNVIRFLGLIDEKGAKSTAHQALFSIADDAQFAQEFATIVHEAYGELFKLRGDDAWQLQKPQLSTFFRQSDGTSAVVGDRQVATFVALAELSGKRVATGNLKAGQTSDQKKKPTPTAIKGNNAAKPPAAANAPEGNGQNNRQKPEFSREVGVSVKVEVILPAEASAETYDNIFRSIRKNLIE